VLVFTTSSRSGKPKYTVRIRPDGTYTVHLLPGHYYMATTAATYNGIAAPGPDISVTNGQDLRVNITQEIK
jgi:hypothetical protein